MDYSSLFSLVLPNGVLDFFEIHDCVILSTKVDLFLDEKPYLPEGFAVNDFISHGFTKERIIQDFPFRDKSLYLHIRRRRYMKKVDNSTICRDLSIAFDGTRLTAEFAAFLKDIYR